MGILNTSPDSFSDGYEGVESAVRRGLEMAEQGADLIDVGGESTRPGSDEVTESEELDRVLPVIEALRSRCAVPISVDTRRVNVAREAHSLGASVINHVSATLNCDEMIPLLQATDVGYVAMHMPAPPKTMQQHTDYPDGVLSAVCDSLIGVRAKLADAGINEQRVVYDPGIGFGKTLDQNLTLLRNCQVLFELLGRPLLIGLSRKSWLGHLLDAPLAERDCFSAMASILLNENTIGVHRVHNVLLLQRSVKLKRALL